MDCQNICCVDLERVQVGKFKPEFTLEQVMEMSSDQFQSNALRSVDDVIAMLPSVAVEEKQWHLLQRRRKIEFEFSDQQSDLSVVKLEVDGRYVGTARRQENDLQRIDILSKIY
jgi:hypothetical protein